MAGQEAGHQLREVPVSPSAARSPVCSYESETSRGQPRQVCARGSRFLARGSLLWVRGYWLGVIGSVRWGVVLGVGCKVHPQKNPGVALATLKICD